MIVVLGDDLGQDTVGVLLPCLGGLALQGAGGGVPLPAAAAAAGTLLAVHLDGHVAHLARHAIGAVEDLAVVDDAAAHTGAQGDGDEALAAPSAAHIVFRQRRAVGVIFYVQRQVAELVEQPPQRHIPQGQIAGIQDGAAPDLHRAGTAHAHREDVAGIAAGVAAQLRHQGVDGPGQGCRVGDARHLHFPGGQQPSRLVHQPGLQVGAADVDADVFHNRSLPFCRLMASSLLSNWVTKSRPAL